MTEKFEKNGAAVAARNPLWEDAPLARIEALTLKRLYDMKGQGSGQEVLEKLTFERGKLMDPTAVYGPIRQALSRKDGPYLVRAGKRPSPNGGPPLTLLRVTPEGLKALWDTIAHHEAFVAELKAGLPQSEQEQQAGEREPRERKSRSRGARRA